MKMIALAAVIAAISGDAWADDAYLARLIGECRTIEAGHVSYDMQTCIIAAQSVDERLVSLSWSNNRFMRDMGSYCLSYAFGTKADSGSELPVPAMANSCLLGAMVADNKLSSGDYDDELNVIVVSSSNKPSNSNVPKIAPATTTTIDLGPLVLE